jgi:hypothetical protein
MSAIPEAAPANATAPAKLPLWRTIGASYAIWFRNLPELIRITWIWLLIMVPILGLFMWWQAPAMMDMMLHARAGKPDPNEGMTVLTQALNGIIVVPILSSIAVAWHRLLLRGERVTGPYLRLDSVVIGYAVLFFLLGLLPSAPQYLGQFYAALTQPPQATEIRLGGALVSMAGTMLSLIAFFCACRLFMVLPAKALGQDVSFGTAWAATRKNNWRLFWGYLFCLMPMVIIGGVMGYWLTLAEPSRATAAIVWTVLSLLWPLIGMVGVSFLSLAYRHFFERAD